MSRSPDSLRAVFLRHPPRLLLTVLLLWTTMLAGTALLGLSGGFLTAAALAGAAGLGQGFNFFSPSAGIRGLTMARTVSRYFEKLVGHDAGPVRAPLSDLKPGEMDELKALIDALGPQ